MFTITNQQIESLNKLKLEEFITECLPHIAAKHPDWTKGKTEKALRKFATQMIGLCYKYSLYKKESIERFILYKIEFNFDLTKQKKLSELLLAKTEFESQRLDNLYNSLVSKNYSRTVIDLEKENTD